MKYPPCSPFMPASLYMPFQRRVILYWPSPYRLRSFLRLLPPPINKPLDKNAHASLCECEFLVRWRRLASLQIQTQALLGRRPWEPQHSPEGNEILVPLPTWQESLKQDSPQTFSLHPFQGAAGVRAESASGGPGGSHPKAAFQANF